MALLYGEGDFKKTVGIAIAAGFDCDNQAATLAGLIGVMYGESQIPRDLTREIAGNDWKEAFNDVYVNQRRPPLPRNHTNSGIVGKIMLITQKAILEAGGKDLGDTLEIPVSHQVGGGIWQWYVSLNFCLGFQFEVSLEFLEICRGFHSFITPALPVTHVPGAGQQFFARFGIWLVDSVPVVLMRTSHAHENPSHWILRDSIVFMLVHWAPGMFL